MAKADDLSRLTQSIIVAKNELSTAIAQETKSFDSKVDKLTQKVDKLKEAHTALQNQIKSVDKSTKKNSKIIESQVENYFSKQISHLNSQVAKLNNESGNLHSKMETVRIILDRMLEELKSNSGSPSDIDSRLSALEHKWDDFESTNLIQLIDKLESIQEDIRHSHSKLPARDLNELDLKMGSIESKLAEKLHLFKHE